MCGRLSFDSVLLQAVEFLKYNKRQLSRIYPKVTMMILRTKRMTKLKKMWIKMLMVNGGCILSFGKAKPYKSVIYSQMSKSTEKEYQLM